MANISMSAMQAAARQVPAAGEPSTDADDGPSTSGAAAEQTNGHSFADDMRGKAAAKRKAMGKDELPPPVRTGSVLCHSMSS